jgi:Tol biopolymer transport system component
MSGAGKEEPFFMPSRPGWIMDWFANGNWALFRGRKASEVWLEQVQGGAGERVSLKGGEYRFPRTSPDEKWIAYISGESGKDEIYVAPSPLASQLQGKWKISSDGGTRVSWRVWPCLARKPSP